MTSFGIVLCLLTKEASHPGEPAHQRNHWMSVLSSSLERPSHLCLLGPSKNVQVLGFPAGMWATGCLVAPGWKTVHSTVTTDAWSL